MNFSRKKIFIALFVFLFLGSAALNIFFVRKSPEVVFSTSSAARAGSYVAEKEKALSLTRRYYSFLEEGDYDGAMSLHHDRWFQSMNRTDTKSFFSSTDEKTGNVMEYTLESWEAKQYEENDGGRSGMYVIFTFSTKRSKFAATEIVTLFRGTEESNYMILNYHIDSEAFNK